MKTDKSAAQHAILADIFEMGPTKSQRTKLTIIEAAIESYISIGIENTTFDAIAKKCGVSRPLIQRYFPDKKLIFELAVKAIRLNMQRLAIASMKKTSSPKDALEEYIYSTFEWIKQFPSHARVWLLFYYYCSFNEDYKHLNTDLVNAGHKRIADILLSGKNQKQFEFYDAEKTSKLIQTLITGALLEVLTEKLYCDLITFKKGIAKEALRIAGA